MKRIQLFIPIMLFFAPIHATASGYFVQEISAKAHGMGNAFVAKADDLSALFHNPAGLSEQKGLRFYFNGSAAFLWDATYKRAPDRLSNHYKSVSLETDVIPGPNIVITDNMNTDKWVFGFGIYSSFGAIFNWPDDGPQRYNLNYARVYIVNIGPSVAYQITPKLSIGANAHFIWSYSATQLDLDIPFTLGFTDLPSGMEASRVPIRFQANEYSYRGDIGLLYKPTHWLSFGIHYVMPCDLEFSNPIHAKIPVPVQPIFGKEMSINGRINITTPQYVQAGFAVKPFRGFTVATEVLWMDWSVMSVYPIRMEENDLGIKKLIFPKDWKDTYTYKIGFEYKFQSNHALRLGFMHDETCIDDKYFALEVPDMDKIAITAGGTLNVSEKFQIDVAYGYYIFEDRTIENSEQWPPLNGKFSFNYDIMAIAVNYNF